MCRKLALIATAAILISAPALAQTATTPKPAPAVSAPAPPAKPAPVKSAPPAKATAAERLLIERDEPVARATFWARERNIDPADAEAGLKFAAALRALGKYQEAADAAEQVTLHHPDNAEAYLALARAKLEANDGFFAINPARRAEALNPRDWRPLNILGVAFEQTGRDDQAAESYSRGLAIAPNNPDLLNNLALLYARKNDAAQAEKLLRQALAQPRVTAQTRQNLARLLGKQGRLDEARKLMIEDLPPETVENNLAVLRAGA